MMSTSGTLEVVCGPMFCGKTEELIRKLKRATIAKQNVVVITPEMDTRYGAGKIKSHGATDLEKVTGLVPIQVATDLSNFPEIKPEVEVVAGDEVQFFGKKIIDITKDLVYAGKYVMWFGLDLYSDGNPAGSIPELLALADIPRKLQSVCVRCHKPATRSYRLSKKKSRVLLGGAEDYEPRCKTCWLIVDQTECGITLSDNKPSLSNAI